MVIAINKLFAQLLFWLYELLDTIFEMFAVLCGIETLETVDADAPRSLIEIFLQSSAVTRAFLLIVIVSVFVAAASTIVAIVKNIINMKGGERKSHAKTVGQGFGSIIVTLCMALVMIVGISMSNIVLQKVYAATSPDDNVTPASILFDMCVSKDYVIDYNNPVPNMVPKIDPETGEVMKDENGEIIMEVEVDYEGNVVYTYPRMPDPSDPSKDYYTSGWRNNNSVETLSKIVQSDGWNSLTPDKVFGVHKKVLGLFEDADKKYTTQPMVEMETFNFFLAYLVVVIMLVAIIWSMLGLVKRVYDLVLLFMALPLISATIPLDDGARFKQWRDSVVSKVILAYGVVLSINIFLLITPIINNISFASLGWSAFVENLFKAFMLIGGALAINGGQLLFARLFGSSAEESREMAHAARAMFGGAIAAGGILRGVKNLAFGGNNKYGRFTQGAIPLAARATNAVGNKVGGAAYAGSKFGAAMRHIGRASMPSALRGATGGGTTLGGGGVTAYQRATGNAGGVSSAMSGTAAQSAAANTNIDQTANSGNAHYDGAPAPGAAAQSMSQPASGGTGGTTVNVTQQAARTPNSVSSQPENKHSGLINNVIKPKDGEGGAFKPPKK